MSDKFQFIENESEQMISEYVIKNRGHTRVAHGQCVLHNAYGLKQLAFIANKWDKIRAEFNWLKLLCLEYFIENLK